MKRTTIAATLLGFGLASPALAQGGDPAAGEKVFNKCRACHVVDQEQNRVGPHLVGIFGREAGSVEGFNYSDAMANSGIVWDDETMSAYLKDPRGYIEGNKMAFVGLRKDEEVADLLAYLHEAAGG